jgi:hypothetical protein
LSGVCAQSKFAKVIQRRAQQGKLTMKSSASLDSLGWIDGLARREIGSFGGYSRAQWYTARSENGTARPQILLVYSGPLWFFFRPDFAG